MLSLIGNSTFKLWPKKLGVHVTFVIICGKIKIKIWRNPKIKGFILKIEIWNASPLALVM
jgi:hypothetical protein